MSFTVDAFNLAKSKMLGDFNKALSDADDLRTAETEACAATARAAAEKTSKDTGASGAGASRAGEGATAETAGAAGDCKPENPQAAGKQGR